MRKWGGSRACYTGLDHSAHTTQLKNVWIVILTIDSEVNRSVMYWGCALVPLNLLFLHIKAYFLATKREALHASGLSLQDKVKILTSGCHTMPICANAWMGLFCRVCLPSVFMCAMERETIHLWHYIHIHVSVWGMKKWDRVNISMLMCLILTEPICEVVIRH